MALGELAFLKGGLWASILTEPGRLLTLNGGGTVCNVLIFGAYQKVMSPFRTRSRLDSFDQNGITKEMSKGNGNQKIPFF